MSENKIWTCNQWNLHAESNRNLSRTRILPLDHEDLLQTEAVLSFLALLNFYFERGDINEINKKRAAPTKKV